MSAPTVYDKVAGMSDATFANVVTAIIGSGLSFTESPGTLTSGGLTAMEREAGRVTIAVIVATLATRRYDMTIPPSECRDLLSIYSDMSLKDRLRLVRNAMAVWAEKAKAGVP